MLNDEFVRIRALPVLDRDGLLSLAKQYAARGMKAKAREVLREAYLSEDML